MVYFKGQGFVWDKERDSLLCKFPASGVVGTENSRVIAKMRELGYEEIEVAAPSVAKKGKGKVVGDAAETSADLPFVVAPINRGNLDGEDDEDLAGDGEGEVLPPLNPDGLAPYTPPAAKSGKGSKK